VSWRPLRYAALGMFAVIAGLGALAVCAAGTLFFGVVGFGFANATCLVLAATCLAMGVGACFANVRLVIPLVRFCLREARGLESV
jgi:hypothetical protein